MIYPSLASLILRISFGGMMLVHGLGKFQRLMSGETSFADPIGFGELNTLLIAVFSEYISPILLIIGFKTRWATVLPAITMIIITFIVHADDPWKKQEFPLLYFFGFVAIYLLGSGKYSLDWRLKKI